MYKNISELLGKTLTKAYRGEHPYEGECITFVTTEGETYRLFHYQGCCESVTIEDINGDLNDLVGSPITQAEESTSHTNPTDHAAPEYQDSFTWTFYKLATKKGYVTIRWYGESNGYYSESVDFEKVT